MKDTWIDKIKHFYWQHWSYDWRPGQVWYRLKCFLWHRYTTVRSRYHGHTWCDKTELMPHAMFELLSRFIEQECSPGHVEWYGEWGHKITVDGEEKYVRDEMQELYDWWHTVWNVEWGEVDDMLWAEAHKHPSISNTRQIKNSDLFEWKQTFETEEDEAIYKNCIKAINKLERMMDEALQARLHRLVNIIPYLWT
jgi:hypothetical protein